MRNRLRRLLAAGEPALNAQLRLGTPAIAELFGLAGFDFVVAQEVDRSLPDDGDWDDLDFDMM